jgi:hypothetical protein
MTAPVIASSTKKWPTPVPGPMLLRPEAINTIQRPSNALLPITALP